MDSYRKYSYEISEADLLQVLRDAASLGYMPHVVINGEYYTVKFDQLPSVEQEEIF